MKTEVLNLNCASRSDRLLDSVRPVVASLTAGLAARTPSREGLEALPDSKKPAPWRLELGRAEAAAQQMQCRTEHASSAKSALGNLKSFQPPISASMQESTARS